MEARLLTALEALEQERVQLHEALRQAHFSMGLTQRAEESRGHLLSIETFPIDDDTLSPLIRVTCDAEGSDSRDWAVQLRKGQSPSAPSAASTGESSDSTETVFDPIFYVSGAPSADLRACQAAYQAVMVAVVRAANAQTRVLHLSEQLAAQD